MSEGTKPKKKLRGFAGIISKFIFPLNESERFKRHFKDTSLRIMLNPIDQKIAAIIILDKGTIDVEAFRKKDVLEKIKKKDHNCGGLLSVTTQMLLELAMGKMGVGGLLKATLKSRKVKLKGKLKLMQLAKMFAILEKDSKGSS